MDHCLTLQPTAQELSLLSKGHFQRKENDQEQEWLQPPSQLETEDARTARPLKQQLTIDSEVMMEMDRWRSQAGVQELPVPQLTSKSATQRSSCLNKPQKPQSINHSHLLYNYGGTSQLLISNSYPYSLEAAQGSLPQIAESNSLNQATECSARKRSLQVELRVMGKEEQSFKTSQVERLALLSAKIMNHSSKADTDL